MPSACSMMRGVRSGEVRREGVADDWPLAAPGAVHSCGGVATLALVLTLAAACRDDAPGALEAPGERESAPVAVAAAIVADRAEDPDSLGTASLTLPFLGTATSDAQPAFWIRQRGLGAAGWFTALNASASQPALGADHYGPGSALLARHYGSGSAVKGVAEGTSSAGVFEINDAFNANAALVARTLGSAWAGRFEINRPGNVSSALYAVTNGGGQAGLFEISRTSNVSAALVSTTRGLGRAGFFHILNNGNSDVALVAQTSGTGRSAFIENYHAANRSPSLHASTRGVGPAGLFEITNTSSASSTLVATTRGTGQAGVFSIQNAGNPHAALASRTDGTGPGAIIEIVNPASRGTALLASTLGSGIAVVGTNYGGGRAATFVNLGSTNSSPALSVHTDGTGDAIIANQAGASGSLAVFQSNFVNQIRFTKKGLGIFNGGTQTGGADLAEAIAVEGSVRDYEPGDVLVISGRHARRVERSSKPYDARVIGVHATKPGVLLTERGVDASLDDLVPVGVVGVIPTKVSAENGAIRLGDLLVTAATPRHAMRGTDRDRMFGATIGKALEEFTGPGTGVIRVLVNVK